MPAVRKTKLMELIWKVHPWLYLKSGRRIETRIAGVARQSGTLEEPCKFSLAIAGLVQTQLDKRAQIKA